MVKYDIIIVGGGPAGVVSAITSKNYYPNKKILLIKNVNRGVIPCGIPYILNSLKSCTDNELGYSPLEKKGINVITGTVKNIDKKNKKVITAKSKFTYNKLILATGSIPLIPPIEGIDKIGVYPVRKDMNYLKKIKRIIKKSKNVVLLGGGYIGVEFADEISDIGNKKITLIEMLPRILNSSSPEFSDKIKSILERKKVKIMTNSKVTKILGDKKVNSVKVGSKKIKADVVILGAGAGSNYSLAEKAGLKTRGKSIFVDKFQRTSDKNIFAVGDCAYKRDFITSEQSRALLASSACNEARIACKNLFSKKIKNLGTIGIYSTKVGDISLGAAGITEKRANKENIKVIVGSSSSPDKHPGKMPGTKIINMKLIFSRKNKTIIGAEILGGDSIGEIINIAGLAIQNKLNAEDIVNLEIGTHPKLTPPPTKYPLIMAAQDALSK